MGTGIKIYPDNAVNLFSTSSEEPRSNLLGIFQGIS
jgi:hypothetical protein